MNTSKYAPISAQALAAMAIAVMLTACAPEPETDNGKGYQADTIKVLYSDTYSYAVPQLMMLTGSLQAALPKDVAVHWQFVVNSTAELRDALATGHVDFGLQGGPAVIAGLENGLPARILANTVFQSIKLYSNHGNVWSFDDLSPQDKISIATVGGATGLTFLLYIKEKYGDPSKFNDYLLPIQYPELFASLSSSDDIAYSVVGFPYTMIADGHAKMRLIDDLTPIAIKYNLGMFLLANEKFYQENPALVDIFRKVAENTIDFMNTNSTEAARILAELEFYQGVSIADIEKQIQEFPPSFSISESAYNTVAGLMYEMGILSVSPKPFSALPNYGSIPKLP